MPKRKTLEDAQALAALRGGQCLSMSYTNNSTPMQWQCEHGHRWEASYNVIQQGSWCPQCFNESRRYTLEKMQALATSRGGRCLSTRYSGSRQHLIWECAQGHTWLAAPNSVMQGTWCPKCSRESSTRHTLAEMQALAASHGGRCLSTHYASVKAPLEWECKRGHTWWARPDNVIYGTWCPQCAILDRTRTPRHRKKYLAVKPVK